MWVPESSSRAPLVAMSEHHTGLTTPKLGEACVLEDASGHGVQDPELLPPFG